MTEDPEDNMVYYCKDCLSLSIKTTELDIDFCGDCGSTDIGHCPFEEWQKKYKSKYGRNFLNIKENGRKNWRSR